MNGGRWRRPPGLLLGALLALALPGEAQRKCGAAKDLLVHALEQMTPASTADQIDRASGLINTATGMCGELGDAWYYRSLLLRRAGQVQRADGALERARHLDSEAAAEKRDPFVLAVPKGNGPPLASRPREKWALVVGVAQFKDENIDQLKFSGADAQSFADVLMDPAVGNFKRDHVHVLLNGDATFKNIKKDLNWLARSAEPDDLVVIYVATHGSPGKDDTAGVNYVLPYDTEVGPEIDPDLLFATALPMVEISDTVTTRIRAARAAIFLDTCFSENAMGKAGAVGKPGAKAVSAETLNHIREGGGRMILAASGSDQESYESEKLAHGYFTYYLVQGLREKGGAAPLSAIYDYVHAHVSSDVARDKARFGLHQDPVMSRSEAGTDFTLGEMKVGAMAGTTRGDRSVGR